MMQSLQERIDPDNSELGFYGLAPQKPAIAVQGSHIFLGLVQGYTELNRCLIFPNLIDGALHYQKQ